jgi:hypothetical protein
VPIINFIGNHSWLTKDSKSKPVPTLKSIPKWYKKANRFVKKSDKEYLIGYDNEKIFNWKACPIILDIMMTGYNLVTPCNIEFFLDEYGEIDCKVEDQAYKNFARKRGFMPEFYYPEEYYSDHFVWMPDWGVKVPDGYSVLYVSPFNRYDLPIMTVPGIIDNDKLTVPGLFPFFVKKGWTGILPAGTPYAQLLPFLREDWQSEIIIQTSSQIVNSNRENSVKYHVPGGGVYQKEVWTKRLYE